MCGDIVREVLGAQVSARLQAAQVGSLRLIASFSRASRGPAPLFPPRFSLSALQKTRPDALAFLSDFVIDAVVEQFARDVVLECTRERSREALYVARPLPSLYFCNTSAGTS
jgi:hypothetical protein